MFMDGEKYGDSRFYARESLSYHFSEKYAFMPDLMDTKIQTDTSYKIFNIRFEIETSGHATIWFNLDGPAFEEPEAMENMFVEFDRFLGYLEHQSSHIYEALVGEASSHETWLERLETADFDWNEHLRRYIDRHVDLEAAEKKRMEWLHARRVRQEGPKEQKLETGWLHLSSQAEPSGDPTWDDVVHAIIAGLNDTATELYPEVLDFGKEDNARLREMLESHGERLANQLYALTKSVREEQQKTEARS